MSDEQIETRLSLLEQAMRSMGETLDGIRSDMRTYLKAVEDSASIRVRMDRCEEDGRVLRSHLMKVVLFVITTVIAGVMAFVIKGG